MKKNINGKIVEITSEEIAEQQAQAEVEERKRWLSIPYDDAVNDEIRKRYTESQEFAILRQQAEKPDEYREYYDYCEACKAFVKQKKEEYANGSTEV